jgi:putative Mg2+ transporter-C (MgtC) family protein
MSLDATVPVSTADVLLRLTVAFCMGSLFGLERQFNKKPVGFGPFTFVASGAAAMTIVGMLLSDQPLPILGAILTGIGFLGAGAIIRTGERRVTGLTTAASLWVFAALGVVVGVGLYVEAIILYAMVGVVVLLDYYFERYGFGSYSKSVTLTVNTLERMRAIEHTLPQHRTFVYSFDNAKKEYTATFLIAGTRREVNKTLSSILTQQGVLTIKVE